MMDEKKLRARFAELRKAKDALDAERTPHQAAVDKIASREGELREERRKIAPKLDAVAAKMAPIDTEIAMIARALKGQTGTPAA